MVATHQDIHPGIAKKSFYAFFLTLLVCLAMSYMAIDRELALQKLSMEQLIIEKTLKISHSISKLLYKTQALSALVIHNNGTLPDFTRIAGAIADDSAILNILLAPDGVVSHIYPLEGNEKLLGYNLLGQGDGNKEAIAAKEKGELVFGGPFKLYQGGLGLVGRMPVELEDKNGNSKFWGLVSVTLKYPAALSGAGLDSLAREGLAYEIWRINPDTGERQTIAGKRLEQDDKELYVEKSIPLFNAQWYFRIMPFRYWYEYPESWLLLFSSFSLSFLLAVIVHHNTVLRRMKDQLEKLLHTDALTGLPNRAGLFTQLDRLIAGRRRFSLFYIDLNYFKEINDTFGHATGDKVLREFSSRFVRNLSPDDSFARVGGDEFILVHPTSTTLPLHDAKFWHRISKEFAIPIKSENNEPFMLSFSVGMAAFPHDGTDTQRIIACADKRMYAQKSAKYAREKRRRAGDVKKGFILRNERVKENRLCRLPEKGWLQFPQ